MISYESALGHNGKARSRMRNGHLGGSQKRQRQTHVYGWRGSSEGLEVGRPSLLDVFSQHNACGVLGEVIKSPRM